jgi:hypothetical protein
MEINNTIGNIIIHNNHEYILTSPAWWLCDAIKTNDGKIIVAKIDANSTTLKTRSNAELEELEKEFGWRINRYEQSTEFNGDYVRYMLSLTEDDIINHNITPGKLNFPDVIPCKRPKQSIITENQHNHNMIMLQTEGHGYDDYNNDNKTDNKTDNTPYMKGDDIDD